MTKNVSNEAPDGHIGVEIASMALTTDVNPILHGEDFWSLQDGGFASANLKARGLTPPARAFWSGWSTKG